MPRDFFSDHVNCVTYDRNWNTIADTLILKKVQHCW